MKKYVQLLKVLYDRISLPPATSGVIAKEYGDTMRHTSSNLKNLRTISAVYAKKVEGKTKYLWSINKHGLDILKYKGVISAEEYTKVLKDIEKTRWLSGETA